MAGNVWEWSLTDKKTGGLDSSRTDIRVLRGGSFISYIRDVQSISRNFGNPPNFRDDDFGFRICAIP
jgi:formylglycine-generating enzyme required for sulfatase activity